MRTLVLMLACWWSLAVQADQWERPSPRTYSSWYGGYRLTVYPAERATSRPCEATLEKLDGNKYVEVWRKRLVNKVAPVSALISEKDASFVTFDNWGKMGRGDDVMVIYDGSGALKRKFALNDFVSEAEQESMMRGVSSIHWGGNHVLDHQVNILHVVIVGYERKAPRWWSIDPPEPKRTFRTIRIGLGTTQIIPDPPASGS